MGSFLFSTFLAFAILTFTVIELTDYNNLQQLFIDLFSVHVWGEQKPEEAHKALLVMCEGKESVELPFASEGEGEGLGIDIKSIELRCADIREVNPEDLSKLAATAFFEKIYYKTYSCSFIDCVKTGQFMVFFSAKGNQFFKTLQNVFWVGTAVGAFMLFISLQTWSSRLKKFGTIIVLTSVPFVSLKLVKFMLPSVELPMLDETNAVTSYVFEPMYTNFLILLVVGIALTAAGYGLSRYESRITKK